MAGNPGDFSIGDFGLALEITVVDRLGVADDISDGTTLEMHLTDPDEVTTVYTATFTNSGTDGNIQYVIADATVLSKAGQWSYRASIAAPTRTFRTVPVDFIVVA